MKNINLAPRMESSTRYDANRNINNLISICFTASLENVTATTFDNVVHKPIAKVISTVESEHYINPLTPIPCGDLAYGPTTTLRKSGCAVFCFHQGLSVQGIYSDLEDLADEIAKKGYYEEGKGTWHCLFDHYGLRRVSHYSEITDALLRNSICTCLVDNSIYHADSTKKGKHFVNVVGQISSNVIVDDSNFGRKEMDFAKFLKAISIAWIW